MNGRARRRGYFIGLVGLFWLGLMTAWADPQPISWDLAPEFSNYTVQHVLEVGDTPGHNLRVAELVRDYREVSDPPQFNGVRVLREVNRFFSDYVDINGAFTGYVTYEMANGEEIYGQLSGNAHTLLEADGSLSTTRWAGVVNITGGTGSFLAIRGMIRISGEAEPRANVNVARAEGTYWMAE